MTDNEAVALALVAHDRSTRDLILALGRRMAAANPERFANVKRQFEERIAEWTVRTQLSPETQTQWVQDIGGIETVLFDSAHHTPRPEPPSYG